MTGTKRSVSPRALLRDRSLSKDKGSDKSLKKRGAGGHNWGRVGVLELDFDQDDYQITQEMDEDDFDDFEENKSEKSADTASDVSQLSKSAPTESDISEAIKYRENALRKKELDLGAIARSSVAISGSPTDKKFVHNF